MHFSYILPFISVFSQLALSRPQTLPAGTLVSTEDGTVEPLVPFTDDSNFEQVELKRADTSTNKRQHDITGPYYLKTSVLNGGDVHKDGLYVWAYHTGAGLNDAVLGDKGKARPAYLNSTYQMFNLSGDSTPWTFFLPSNTNYAGWELVSINAGYATSDLFLNDTGLVWTTYESFGGWLACDWWHGLPQLFWKVSHYNYSISSCAQIELIPETIDGED